MERKRRWRRRHLIEAFVAVAAAVAATVAWADTISVDGDTLSTESNNVTATRGETVTAKFIQGAGGNDGCNADAQHAVTVTTSVVSGTAATWNSATTSITGCTTATGGEATYTVGAGAALAATTKLRGTPSGGIAGNNGWVGTGVAEFDVRVIPRSPASLTATPATSPSVRVNIAWPKSLDETAADFTYEVQKKAGAGAYGASTTVTATGAASYSLADTSVVPGTTYCYIVRARYSAGAGTNVASDFASEQCATPVATDRTPPTLHLPASMTVEATSGSGAVVSFTATADDANPAHPTVTCVPASGSTFALGTTTVNCSATDAATNTANGSFTVTVVDTTPPSVTVPSNMTVEATSSSGAVVTFSASASDLVDGSITPTCVPASGSTFPLGTTTVNCSATDAHSNTGSNSFTVTVQDTTPPSINCTVPDQTAWYAVNKTVNCTASDAVSGLADPTNDLSFSLSTSVVAGNETASASTGSNQVCDTVGNCDTAGPYTFKIDRKKPQQSSCDTADGLWHNANVTLYCSYTDGGSGPATQNVDLSTNVAAGAENGNAAASAGGNQACDAVSNCADSPADITGNKIDRKAPTFGGCTPASFILGSGGGTQSVSITADDGGSGLDAGASTLTGTVDTSTIGTKTVNYTAVDNVANTRNRSCEYAVVFDWKGFFQPVDNDRLNRVKAGSAIPVKFSLGGNQGLNIFAAGYPKSTLITCDNGEAVDDIEQTVTAGGSSLTYDATAGQYVYVWKTEKSWAGSCRRLEARLVDGTVHTADFNFAR